MAGQAGFSDADDRLKRLSDLGDQLDAFAKVIDFELIRPDLLEALAYSSGAQGGRPPFDPVMMLKILVIQAANTLLDERTEFLINDRLSFMRFLGLGLSDRVPDARTIWLFREKRTKACAIQPLFDRLDASLIAAPKQRNTRAEWETIKQSEVPAEWQKQPAKLRQKDRQARWTVKFTKAKPRADGSKPPVDIAIPSFGYQNHIAIDRRFGLIRRWQVTDAAAYEGARLREGLLDRRNTASNVWADTAYRSKENEAYLARLGFVSRIHRKKPRGQPMPERTLRANAAKSAVRSRVEHVFAEQKHRMGLLVRTIGIARATLKIGMANIVYNLKRLIVLQRGRQAAA